VRRNLVLINERRSISPTNLTDHFAEYVAHFPSIRKSNSTASQIRKFYKLACFPNRGCRRHIRGFIKWPAYEMGDPSVIPSQKAQSTVHFASEAKLKAVVMWNNPKNRSSTCSPNSRLLMPAIPLWAIPLSSVPSVPVPLMGIIGTWTYWPTYHRETRLSSG
jgi:hypothetical protein